MFSCVTLGQEREGQLTLPRINIWQMFPGSYVLCFIKAICCPDLTYAGVSLNKTFILFCLMLYYFLKAVFILPGSILSYSTGTVYSSYWVTVYDFTPSFVISRCYLDEPDAQVNIIPQIVSALAAIVETIMMWHWNNLTVFNSNKYDQLVSALYCNSGSQKWISDLSLKKNAKCK